ncbi:MAG: glycosyltransferase family 4 protein [Desulfovibrio sp.]|nr:glycosyltransferase family 4 protein [Desulfovibrio sp.]
MKEDMSSRGEKHAIFPAGLPHVACVLLWYPLFTQPFIFREVEGLKKLLPLSVFSLYGFNLRHCSTEMRAAASETHTFGLRSFFAVFGECCRCLLLHPVAILRLTRRVLWQRWRSWEMLGENLWAFGVGLCLGRLFKEGGIDMIYAPWPRGTATAAWVASQISGIPFATAARGDNLEPADPDLGNKLAAASVIRANNAADKKRIETFDRGQARGKVELVYNSLTLPLPRNLLQKDAQEKIMPAKAGQSRALGRPVRILALGRFDVTKGFDILMYACGLLRDRGLDFRLTLAGGGGAVMGLGCMDAKIRKLRKNLHLEDRVYLPGLVTHNELPRLLKEHDIFAAPCVVHSSGRRDGIPNTVIEALAYGLPVVSTTVNALPEVVRHNETGLAVPPGDAAALADAIWRLAEDADLANRLARNGQALALEMFDPAQNNRRLAHMFVTHALGGKKPCAA